MLHRVTGPREKKNECDGRRRLAARMGRDGASCSVMFRSFRLYIRCIPSMMQETKPCMYVQWHLTTTRFHVTHYELTSTSAARSLALRARGLLSISCMLGFSGLGVSIRNLAL